MGDDVTDIGVPLTEPTADPGALENDGVLTVDVEAEVEAEAVLHRRPCFHTQEFGCRHW